MIIIILSMMTNINHIIIFIRALMRMVMTGDFTRSKRQVEELAELGETVEEFVQQYGDFQEDWAVKMGNLSCVLVEIQWLKEDMTVNMDFWTTALTGPAVEGGFEFDVEGAAATDPIWRQKLSEANQVTAAVSGTVAVITAAVSGTVIVTTAAVGGTVIVISCITSI